MTSTQDVETPKRAERSFPQRLGTVFSEPSPRWSLAPDLVPIVLPEVPLENSIWGATGRDDAGNIYLGISCDGPGVPSATLCRLLPQSSQAESMGDAVSNLRRLGRAAETISQMKIHSKPVQANDGLVYFASMDEQGEKSDGSQLSVFGSHLWRIDPDSASDPVVSHEWEHLFAAPEALIATGCTGRYVYALGYFQHVVFQYDTETGVTKQATVGSVGGHISRNFLVDLNEHVYVPRVSLTNQEEFEVALVELDSELQEVVSHPLKGYGASKDFDSHGIVGFATLENGDIVFTTAKGAFYRLTPHAAEPSSLERLGWIHPDGESYPAFLCCPDGRRTVCAISQRPRTQSYQWLIHDLDAGETQVVELASESAAWLERPNALVYGSNTRDDQGDAFAVGWFLEKESGGLRPHALRVRWPVAYPSDSEL